MEKPAAANATTVCTDCHVRSLPYRPLHAANCPARRDHCVRHPGVYLASCDTCMEIYRAA